MISVARGTLADVDVTVRAAVPTLWRLIFTDLTVSAAIAAGDARGALEVSERLSTSGRDVTQFARDLLARLRAAVERSGRDA